MRRDRSGAGHRDRGRDPQEQPPAAGEHRIGPGGVHAAAPWLLDRRDRVDVLADVRRERVVRQHREALPAHHRPEQGDGREHPEPRPPRHQQRPDADHVGGRSHDE